MLFGKKRKLSSEYGKIIVSEKTIKSKDEGYNRLKDNILFLNADGKAKVLQIESSVAHECKTTVACNLAVSLGCTGKKVAVVELDFRRPRAHRLFGIPKEGGISDYLLGKIGKEEVAKRTQYENVDVVTRGDTIDNPTIVLISDKFKELMDYLRESYDFVILDCAPVLQVSDYIHISKISDGVIFLVAYGITTRYQVQDAISELKKNDVKVLGSVFTMYDNKSDYKYYYGYHNYYRDYYKVDED